MSVLESDTNEKIVSESVLKYASNPEMSNPKEENVKGNSNSSISLLYKPFKYKTFLASRYSLELDIENKKINKYQDPRLQGEGRSRTSNQSSMHHAAWQHISYS